MKRGYGVHLRDLCHEKKLSAPTLQRGNKSIIREQHFQNLNEISSRCSQASCSHIPLVFTTSVGGEKGIIQMLSCETAK